MEEEEKQKSEEKPDEEQKDVDNEADNDKNVSKERECVQKETVAEREEDIETTEYDISTDDESLRMIFSSTDQVIKDKILHYFLPTPVSVELLLGAVLPQVQHGLLPRPAQPGASHSSY